MAPRVHTPVDGYTGTVAGVNFANGVGETDDSAALLYFSGAGYRIDGEQAPPAPVAPQPEPVTPQEPAALVAPIEPQPEPVTPQEPAALVAPTEPQPEPVVTPDEGKPERPHPVRGNKAEWFDYLSKRKPDHGFDLEKVQRKELIEAANEVDGITAE